MKQNLRSIFSSPKTTFTFFAILLFALSAYAQKGISEADKVVFIYVENRETNLIVIPNFGGRVFSVKIYYKLKDETTFREAATIKRPNYFGTLLNKPGPYSIQWEDTQHHARVVDYKIICYDKQGTEAGEMMLIWEEPKGSKNSNSITPPPDSVKKE